jgi:hypothetical protein
VQTYIENGEKNNKNYKKVITIGNKTSVYLMILYNFLQKTTSQNKKKEAKRKEMCAMIY